MSKMYPEAKEKIVAALRSGKYKQGRGQLRKGDCYCVWGVICDVSGLGEWDDPFLNKIYEYNGYEAIAPISVRDWVFPKGSSKIMLHNHSKSLMYHNDNGATFEQLADAIEEQL